MIATDISQFLSPPARRTLADEVVERVRDAILTGQLAPGEQLREGALAESLAVSRGPVREALKRLEREGLVIVRTNRRAFVARLSREDAEEVYSLRNALERLAVTCACRNATPTDLENMRFVVAKMASRIGADMSEQEAAELDVEFHDALYQASRHKRLADSWANLRPMISVFLLSRNVADADFRATAAVGHQMILDAIAARDETKAVGAIELHLRYGYERVLSSYDRASRDPGQKLMTERS